MATLPLDNDDAIITERVFAALTKWQQLHVLAVLQRTDGSDSALRAQLVHFERWYHGGLDTYLDNATRLFRAQQQQQHGTAVADDLPVAASDAFTDWLPSVPHVTPWPSSNDSNSSNNSDAPAQVAHLDSPLYRDLEALGLEHIGESAFVVVAGGLGERLGYDGIKLKLPVETLSHTSYLELYIQHLLALQTLANAAIGSGTPVRIPLAIMTSDVTHDATRAFLTANAYFGMHEQQVALLKQEKVPCLDIGTDGLNSLALALTTDTSLPQLIMKPHGHGDVHALLHSSGLAASWYNNHNTRYVHFFQDTNALIVHSFLSVLGATVRNNWAFTFTAVQRKAKDASGAIVRFIEPLAASSSTEPLTALLNVEYHELDAFLQRFARDAFPSGDANDARSGFSVFPGNINHVVVELATYTAVLQASSGCVPEVFNPKYSSAATDSDSVRRFAAPARLECMLQDYPKLLVQCHDALATHQQVSRSTGYVLFPPALVYSPCKNDVASARVKAAQDVPPQCASSAEHDLFAVNRARLAAVGVDFEPLPTLSSPTKWLGVPLDCVGPQIVLTPQFAPTLAVLSKRFPMPKHIAISHRSTLVVNGDVTFETLALDGALRIIATAGARVVVRKLRVTNAGYEYVSADADAQSDPIVAMRGYVLEPLAVREFVFDVPGDYTIDEDDEEEAAA